jgi:hypothetical protein
VKWESTFYTSSKADLADCESLTKATTMATDYDTLENLNTGTGTFNDSNVNFYVIAGTEIWNSGAQGCCVYIV